jgi:hypothetical protein
MIALLALAVSSAYSNTPADVAIQAVHNFGACAAERTPQGARDVLALDYRSPEYGKRMRAFIKGHDYCIPFNGAMSSARLLFAGAVAEGLLKSDLKQSDLRRRLAFDPQRDVIAARSPAEAMALCSVLGAPEITVKILNTEPATPDETQAMKPLGGVLTQCLKQGTQMTLNKPALRSLLALAAWRIVTTPRKAAE